MDWRSDRKHYTKDCSKWRRSNRGILKPNHHYYMRLIKKETDEFLRENKDYLLANKPEIYYSMINRKLPKKYIKEEKVITPVNSYIPPQSKMSREELDQSLEKQISERKEREQALKIKKEKERKEQERIRRNREAAERENSYIHWVDPFEPVNKNKLGHSQSWRIEKKYEYY